ncbi:MAG: hypothetical protein PVF51_01695 [Nitrospirota bacterium]|jgi:hypothetical protein
MTAQRMVFFTMAVVILIGIALTGFGKVHWFLYLPVAALCFAGVTGICPSMRLWQKLGFK